MSEKETLSEGGIALQYAAPSPYDLPTAIQVEAQDPEEKTDEVAPAEDAPADEPTDEEPKETGPSEEEMLDEIENSPGVQWKKYLRPILKIIKDTKLKVPIELHNSYTIGLDNDTSLGFHIVGIVHFLEDVPEDIAVELQGEPLRFDAAITPDGSLGDVDLVYPTLSTPYMPTFHVNRNVYHL
jgi:hypothetical protein